MFNNVAFDVVIGLTFIYLLYSLLISILGEFVSTQLGIRARLLRIAIERMLNDGLYARNEPAIRTWFRHAFLYEPEEFKTSFAGKFYAYPSIKYLGRIEEQRKGVFTLTKPSYFSAENFAGTLINLLKDKSTGTTDDEKINFALQFNTHGIEPQTLKQIRNLWDTAGCEKEAFRKNLMGWFNETMDRTHGWFKRKIQTILLLLGFMVAASFNLDTIKIAQILAIDKEARQEMVGLAIAFSKDSSRYEEFRGPKVDSISKAALDSSYRQISKDIEQANSILGLGWDFTSVFKDDKTVCAASKISDKDVKQLNAFVKQRKYLETKLVNAGDSLKLEEEELQRRHADTLLSRSAQVLATRKAAVKFQDSIVTVRRNSLAANTQLLVKTKEIIKTKSDNFIKASGSNLHIVDSVACEGKNCTLYGRREYDIGEKTWYLLKSITFNFFGLMLTAIALSMGAPFWFDLLKKLVSIRTVGVKPEEKEEYKKKVEAEMKGNIQDPTVTPSTLQAKLVSENDMVEAALKIYKPKLKSIPGFKSIFRVKNTVQVNVEDEATRNEIIRQVPEMIVESTNVPYEIKITGSPEPNLGPGEILNLTGRNGSGALGCILIRKDTGSRHILSCWHVMKGNTQYAIPDNFILIGDHNKKGIAERWGGSIEGPFDYGLAACVEEQTNDLLKNKLKLPGRVSHGVVTKNDINTQQPIFYFDAIAQCKVDGIIYADSSEVQIQYADKARVLNDVLLLVNENGGSISKGGNSGSVVFNSRKEAIAMIVAGDSEYTYALRLSHFFRIHDEMIIE